MRKSTVFQRVAVLLAGLALWPVASAQDYPARPVSVVLPYSAGTGIDAAARAVAEGLQGRLGQPFVMLNRTGAGGNIGTEQVAKAPPDGYTVLVVANTLAMNQSMYRNLRFDPVKDLAPVALMFKGAMVLVASPGAPSTDLRTLIELSRREPTRLNYASPGVGTPQHLAMEMLKNTTHLNAQHIPHRGAAEAVTGVAGNEVDLAFVPVQSALAMVATGRLRPVAVSSARRNPLLPRVPTVAELIGAPFDVDLWYAMFVPAATPRPIVESLARETRLVLEDADLQRKVDALGLAVSYGGAEELRSLLARDLERWAAVVQKANITAE